MVAAAEGGQGGYRASTTELDSHANMVVLGNHCTVVQETGKCANVNAFLSEVQALPKVPIVDAALAYDCPFLLKMYILVVKGFLHKKDFLVQKQFFLFHNPLYF